MKRRVIQNQPGESRRSGRKRHGRATRRLDDRHAKIERAPFVNRNMAPLEVLSDAGLAVIERNAETILQEIGIEFRGDPEILEILSNAGASVQGQRAHFEIGMCRKIIQENAPPSFVQHARNPKNNVVIGGQSTVFGPSWGPPFIHNLDEGRRYATIDDFRALVKLHQMLPYLHHSGGVVCEPVDLPANKRHLDMLYGHMRYSDRAFFGALIGSKRAQHSVDLAKILFGEEFVAENCVLYAVSNTNAPLVLDSAMSGSLKVYARNNQAVACTPWTLAGAMSPCTVAGTLAQVLAEAMAVLALVQIINPGCPCLMGSFASTMSMQSGSPTFGTPESAKLVLASGQLARRLGVPFHTVGTLSASKLPDAQSQQEGTFGLVMAILSGANFVNHATGWLEGGLVTSFEKTIIDHDLCGKLLNLFSGIDLSDSAQALDAIREVGPGGHYLSCTHTLSHYASAFYASSSSDSSSFEQWKSEGSIDAAQRANRIWKRLLEDYQDPGLDPAIDEALQAYILMRKEETPDAAFY